MAEEKKVERKGLGRWLREMKSELKKVVWPDGKTTMKNTLTVLAVSLAIGLLIWVFDAVAINGVKLLIDLFRKQTDLPPLEEAETIIEQAGVALGSLFGRF